MQIGEDGRPGGWAEMKGKKGEGLDGGERQEGRERTLKSEASSEFMWLRS